MTNHECLSARWSLCFLVLATLAPLAQAQNRHKSTNKIFSGGGTSYARTLTEAWQYARELERAGQASGAISQYKLVLSLDPENRLVLLDMARVYDRSAQRMEAYQSYKQAFMLAPGERGAPANDLVAMSRFGELCLELRRNAEAAVIYQRFALVRVKGRDLIQYPVQRGQDARTWRAHSYLIVALERRNKSGGNMPPAIDFVNRAIELTPGDWIAHHIKALVLNRQRDKNGSRAAFREALRLAPNTFHQSLREQIKALGLTTGSSTLSIRPDGRAEYRIVRIYPDGSREEATSVQSRKVTGLTSISTRGR